MIGESPTRPHFLPVMPPVEVAAARLPCAASATAPTVPISDSRQACGGPARSRSSSRRRRSVAKWLFGTGLSPCSSANSSAPVPASMTCGERSITSRASSTGLRTCRTPVTAPALSVCPSMIEASSSITPSWLNTAPRPALNRGESSRTRTAAATASTLVPADPSTA